MKFRPMIGFVLVAALAFGACGDDDGGSVRDVTCDEPSGSGSETASSDASASGSGAASSTDCETGSASGTASGSGVAVCNPFGDQAAADVTVDVALSEWAISSDPAEAPAGTVHFAIENAGAEVHELAVIAGFADPADLPVEDGVLDEAALPEGALIGEVEGFPAGETCDGTFDLVAGDYLLTCLIVETADDGTQESHLDLGMATGFVVTA